MNWFRKRPRTAVVALALIATIHVASVAAVDVHREIIAPAQQYVGAGYCHGGTDLPCFDCSGFVRNVYLPISPEIPRISNDMARYGELVERSNLRAGDLVFFTTGTRRDVVTHVAIYMGQDSIIHAISDGPNRGVTVTPLSARYWRTRYHSAEGEFHGTGEYRWASGDVYRGEFVEGEMVTAEPTQETYMETASSPWDTWDGIVDGDFQAWLEQEQNAFEEWKRTN